MDDVYIWPMDVDSLFTEVEKEKTVAYQVFEMATNVEQYDFDQLSLENPIMENVLSLSNPEVRQSLCKLLHNIEIRNGFRLTFREVLSLTSYLILPRLGEKKLLNQLQLISNGDLFERLSARILVNKELFYNKLFSAFPSIDHHPKIPVELTGFEKILKAINTNPRDGGAIERNILSRDYSEIDPNKLRSDTVIVGDLTIRKFNKAFSTSISDGLTVVEPYILPSEMELIRDFVKLEHRLFSLLDKSPKSTHFFENCLRFVKKYVSLVIKRSICVRNQKFNNTELYDEYRECITKPSSLPY